MGVHPLNILRPLTGGSKAETKPQTRKLARATQPTGKEIFFGEDEIIVSKTDLTGRITYANDVFMRIAGFSEDEPLGAPHSILRHPDMPRAVFKLLWVTIEAKKEIFAYVKNMARNGDHYWVFAHATPSLDDAGNIIGYHSNRRVPDPAQVAAVEPIYKQLLEIEASHADRKAGLDASFGAVLALLQEKGMDYDEFVFSI